MRASFFTSNKSFLFAVTPVSPFVGASDAGQIYNGPKTGNQGQGIESWTAARSGVWTLDLPKRSCVQSCTRLLIWLHVWSWELTCIQKHAQMHKWVPGGLHPLDDGWRPDQWTMTRLTKKQKTNRPFEIWWFSPEKICSIRDISFLHHIMYPACVELYTPHYPPVGHL